MKPHFVRHLREDAEILRRMIVALSLLVILVIIGSYLILQETGNFQESIFKSMEMVTHIDMEENYAYVSSLYIISFLGFFLMVYISTILVKIIFTGRFYKSMEEGRKMKQIQFLRDHYVICGGGSLGTAVAKELKANKKEFIVIEKDNESADELNHQGLLAIEGDAFDEEYLNMVGIKKAKVMIACLRDDGSNLLVSLIAKQMNPNIKVIAEATNEKYVKPMKTAGVDEVFLPRSIGGIKLAQMALEK
jgi:voltage-gated potassium channel